MLCVVAKIAKREPEARRLAERRRKFLTDAHNIALGKLRTPHVQKASTKCFNSAAVHNHKLRRPDAALGLRLGEEQAPSVLDPQAPTHLATNERRVGGECCVAL